MAQWLWHSVAEQEVGDVFDSLPRWLRSDGSGKQKRLCAEGQTTRTRAGTQKLAPTHLMYAQMVQDRVHASKRGSSTDI